MLKRPHGDKLFLVFLSILTGLFMISSASGSYSRSVSGSGMHQLAISNKKQITRPQELTNLNLRLQDLMSSYIPEIENTDLQLRIGILIDSINLSLSNSETDSLTISDSYYLMGAYNLMSGNNYNAVYNLESSLAFRDTIDIRYGRALSNLGMAFKGLGDFYKTEEYELKSLEVYNRNPVELSSEMIYTYLILIEAYIELQEYEKAISYSNIALAIAESKPDKVKPVNVVNLYADLGVCYNRTADFSKAKIYLEKSESIHKKNNLDFDKNYINMINTMAITYGAIGLTEKSTEYYERGVALAMALPVNTSFSYNIVNSYAINLGNSGEAKRGEALFRQILKKAYADKEKTPQLYFEVLSNYARYLQDYNIDNKKSLEYFAECMNYVNENPKDILLKYQVILGYSLSLAKSGESQKAIELIQSLLTSDYGVIIDAQIYNNPDIESIKADKTSLRIFKTKYLVLWDIFRKSNDLKILETASKTSEVIVSLLDKIRINISEEDSRLILGDKYRDSYHNAIRDFNILYNRTSDNKYIEKAFEYSEKSKAASLLTSTRELKAVQFQIPSAVAESEFRFKRDIGSLNVLISNETNKEKPNNDLINNWNEKLLENTRLRDSLIKVFENKYPGYYKIKYSTQVASLKDLPHIVGRNGNYLNYLLSDTILYVFVANRRHKQILTLHVDSGFYNNIRQFRSLLSMPDPSADASEAYIKYQTVGIELYKILIDPVLPYLISNKLIISPDNLISYIPFETLPTARSSESMPLYRTIPYMINDFDISYTYSATFMAESVKGSYEFSNRVLAFAPNYPEPIDIRSVVSSRQEITGVLHELPYARQEAEYVTGITGGTLYENSEAKESVYKKEAGKYAIIHLAMHTILNDKDPMNSTLIFSPESDTLEDRYLKTYEVYGIPLKAKMVVLSSCNTGTGFLSSGEGILSLARGFMYSGSQSVVMSMWEIEDRSGTEVVKEFYDNLKRGYTKSGALRNAKIDFFKKSDQLRSHPYFWSALIIYGNNTRLYYTRNIIIASALLGGFMIIYFIIYFVKRIYS